MDYSKLSDLEINLRVAEIIYPGKKFTEAYSFGDPDGPRVQWIQGYAEYLKLDYCNNAADSWPIIEDKKICLAFDVFAEPQDGGAWVAQPAYGWERERVRNDNPLRAAMIVFLMMQESE